MPFKGYYLTPEGELRRNLGEEEVRAAFESKQGLLWVDISDTTEEDGRFLARSFGFHPLAIEDCVDHGIHTPKLDDYGPYLFMILRGIDYTVEADVLQTAELHLFLGSHFVVSTHSGPLHSVDSIAALVEADGRPMRRGAAFLAYALIDALVDNIMPTVDRLRDRTDAIEDELLFNPNEAALRAVIALKRSSLRLSRAMSPQREVLSLLSRGGFGHIAPEAQLYYRDVYDNVVRIEGFNENLRQRTETALAIYLSAVANRQSEAVKSLSMVATIFLPLGVIAGIYGMNFDNMPELHWSWGYFGVLGVMGSVILLTVSGLLTRRWIPARKPRGKRYVSTAVDPQERAGYPGRRL